MTDETDLTAEDVARMWAEGTPAELADLRAAAERRLADWLHEHRDDPDLWADDPGVIVQPRRLGSAVSTTFTADDMDTIRVAVGGGRLSDFVREAVLYAAWKRTRTVPEHTCNPVGCDWCNPLGRGLELAAL